MTVALEALAGELALTFREVIKPHLLAILVAENFKSATYIDEAIATANEGLDVKVTLSGNYANASDDADIAGAPAGARGSRYWSLQAQDRVETLAPVLDNLATILTVPALAEATAADRTATSNSLAQAQAIAFASAIDIKGNLVIGRGATGPADVGGNTDGNGVNLGTGAGVGQSQIWTRKPVSIGVSCGINFRGYAAVLVGAYTGARGVADYASFFGTHAGQDTNQVGRILPGFGTRATGTITFSAAATVGKIYTVNGIVLTVSAAPATAYEFAPGASAAASAANLLKCLLGLTDVAIVQGLYRLDSAAAAVVNVASSSTGTYGNSFTLATNDPSAAVSGLTLGGGTDYANTGDPQVYAGDSAVGFGALAGASRPTTRRATIRATMGALPADGANFRLGFTLARTVTYKAAPAGALDIQIGATIAETLANTVATLNGSADATIDDVTYWAQAGTLFIEHDTASVNTFEVRSYTAALVFEASSLWGGLSNLGANVAFGHNSMSQATTSSSISFGTGSGANSTGGNRATFGNCASASNGRDWFVWGESSLSYAEGNDVIGLGRGISSGTIAAYQAITSVTIDGTITFAAPHGWREGHIYACAWRDRTAGAAAFQRATVGGGAWSNIPAGLGGVNLQPVNAMQARIVETLPDALSGGRNYDYRATGTTTNLDIARYTRNVERSVTIGAGGIARSNTITIGSSAYRDGMQVDAIGFYVPVGELRVPQVGVAGAWPTGSITFSVANGNFADGETVTLNGTVFTAKTAANMAAANTNLIRWFRIGADMWQSLGNLLACIRDSDDQSASAKAVNQGRFWLSATSGVGWRLNYQSYDTAGATYTLASSKAGATISAVVSTLNGFGNAASASPPKDKGEVLFSTSPLRNGNPGKAIYNQATDSWRLI